MPARSAKTELRSMSFIPSLNQIALSVVDLRRTERWFREGLGFLPAGGSRLMMRGPLAAKVQGLPGAASTCWWLVGRNPWFQLEFFQFERPVAELMAHDARACDIGYRRIGVWVEDFDDALSRLADLETAPLSPPVGPAGARRVCVRSPDGVFVELMEDDPAPEWNGRKCAAAVRSVTLSTPDHDRSVQFFHKGLGLPVSLAPLRKREHEAAWRLPGASTRGTILDAGGVLLEVVQYLDPPGRPRPQGYRICDQGILNIAFGQRNRRDFASVYESARIAGATPNCHPIQLFDSGVVYVNDPQGFSVELLWMGSAAANRTWGFEPKPIADRPSPDTHQISHTLLIDAPADEVWRVIADHEGMIHWSGFSPVVRTKDGAPDRDGYGAERTMNGPTGVVTEQVHGWAPTHLLRYRVLKGSPILCHQGEVRLTPSNGKTELTWTIRFRPKVPGAGAVLRALLDHMLAKMLHKQLKPWIESKGDRDLASLTLCQGKRPRSYD